MDQGRSLNWDRCSSQPPTSRLERYAPHSPPEALLVTCTDPILDSSLLAQFRPEPLLVWRSTGPVVPPYGTGHRDLENAIDHAVAELGVKEIAICGHLPCDRLRALLGKEALGEGPVTDPSLDNVRTTRRIVQEKYGHLKLDELLPAIVEENVFVQMAHLRTYPAVLTGLARGKLQLHSWIYDANKDELYGYNPNRSLLLNRIKRLTRPAKRPLPCLDPCDIYLA
ncbi:MAG TPA: carbonic anhydrase [Gemmataceae bacterium]|jgi:carbonic anhydrase|nr:carbonic anhydrase [Gemmataceae bacterium]